MALGNHWAGYAAVTNDHQIIGLLSTGVSQATGSSAICHLPPRAQCDEIASDWNTAKGKQDVVNYWLALKALAYISLAKVSHMAKFDVSGN